MGAHLRAAVYSPTGPVRGRNSVVSAVAPTPPGPLRIVNPSTGATIADVPAADAGAVADAVARARAAQPAWAALPFRERARRLRQFARALRDDATFVETLVAENGKPAYEAELIEIFYTLELTRFYTGRHGRRALADEVRHPLVFATKRARVVHHPRGVVGVIGPGISPSSTILPTASRRCWPAMPRC